MYQKRECPLCKADQKEIVIVKALKDKPVPLFECLKGKASLFSASDGEREIFVDCLRGKNEVEKLSKITCPIPGCYALEKSAECFFSDNWQLKKHLFNAHAGKVVCDVCLENKKVFSHEIVTFPSKFALEQHIRGIEKGSGHKGHPKCGFCNIFFYSDDELYEHCRKMHEECHLCVRAGIKHHYYEGYWQLERHFREQHWLCKELSCLEKKFVVFSTEVEFKAHIAAEHLALKRGQRSAIHNSQSIEASFYLPEIIALAGTRRNRNERNERASLNSENSNRAALNEASSTGIHSNRTQSDVPSSPGQVDNALSSQAASIQAQIHGLSPSNASMLIEAFQQFNVTSQAKEFVKRASQLLPEIEKFERIMLLFQELETNYLKRQALATETNLYLIQLKQFPALEIQPSSPAPITDKKPATPLGKAKIIRIVSNKAPVSWGEQAKKIAARERTSQPVQQREPSKKATLTSCTYKLGVANALRAPNESSEDFPSMDSLSPNRVRSINQLEEAIPTQPEEPEEDSFTLGPSSTSSNPMPSVSGKGKKQKKQLLFHIGH